MLGDPDSVVDQLGSTSNGVARRIAVILIPSNTLASIGLRLSGYDESGNTYIREATFVFKRTGSDAPLEVGDHGSGNIREASDQVWSSDYGPSGNGVGVTASGQNGVVVQWRATLYAFYRKAAGG